MNINFELYRIFYVVANNHNITKAAEELNISQPAISKQIKKLEEQLGGQLFVRTKRGVILTDEGKAFYNYIGLAMENISNAEKKFVSLKHLEYGTIKIGISVTLTKEFLLPYLEEFHMKYPKINIQIITNPPKELFAKLKSGLLDFVVLNMSDEDYGNDIDIIKCKKIQDCFVANSKYSELLNREVSLDELKNYPLIIQAKGSNARVYLDKILKNNNIEIIPSMELASYTLVVEFSKIGLGIGYVTKEYISKELKSKQLFEIKLKEDIPSRHIGIAIPNTSNLSFCAQKMIDIIKGKN